ncbi:hypothetical protein AB0P17_36440 [Streptomyces sp. NPDC088124]|uniref:hypothetical protein n=1 Tax=Streptomyces sp. NPDC088124 TaxID=3154654 RepID=UPI003420EAC3
MSPWRTRVRADHYDVATRARAEPGTWVLAGRYSSGNSAQSMASQVKAAARLPAYQPPGSFDARTEPDGDLTSVLVRYVPRRSTPQTTSTGSTE